MRYVLNGPLKEYRNKMRSDKTKTKLNETTLKPTSHSTIFDIPMRPLREDQKHRHRFTR